MTPAGGGAPATPGAAGSAVGRPRRILLGVCGGVAAYKSADLVRRLRERGHSVRCALTPTAVRFVSPLTLEVLSGHPVFGEEYLEPGRAGDEEHIAAAAWAEVLCIAPGTAHMISTLALGLAPNFLSTLALAFRGPVVVAPAMHSAMWEKPALQENVERLRRSGVTFVGPESGALASGEVGLGRLADAQAIAAACEGSFQSLTLAGLTVLISAGPTQEPIDPVRYLGNRSSGKMGFALAAEAARRGAHTVLVAGPVALATPPGVERIDVRTAREMEEAVRRHAGAADLIVMAAAVADFRPAVYETEKIKRHAGTPEISLVANPDILASLATLAPRALRVGFAAESTLASDEAARKLAAKGAHFLVANDISRSDIGFGAEQNEVTIFGRETDSETLSRRPKSAIASALFDRFEVRLAELSSAAEAGRESGSGRS
ncbi:MAG: bifunctional phosphopantothenoylcysteine decarboxylase/phosphopantothenate--cysteine ligase CoaBC [Thermoanaerobaculia bacterium]